MVPTIIRQELQVQVAYGKVYPIEQVYPFAKTVLDGEERTYMSSYHKV